MVDDYYCYSVEMAGSGHTHREPRHWQWALAGPWWPELQTLQFKYYQSIGLIH